MILKILTTNTTTPLNVLRTLQISMMSTLKTTKLPKSRYRDHFRYAEDGVRTCRSTDQGTDLNGAKYQFEQVKPIRDECLCCNSNLIKSVAVKKPQCFTCVAVEERN